MPLHVAVYQLLFFSSTRKLFQYSSVWPSQSQNLTFKVCFMRPLLRSNYCISKLPTEIKWKLSIICGRFIYERIIYRGVGVEKLQGIVWWFKDGGSDDITSPRPVEWMTRGNSYQILEGKTCVKGDYLERSSGLWIRDTARLEQFRRKGARGSNTLTLLSSPLDLQLEIILAKSIQKPEGRAPVDKVHKGHLLKAENRMKTGE